MDDHLADHESAPVNNGNSESNPEEDKGNLLGNVQGNPENPNLTSPEEKDMQQLASQFENTQQFYEIGRNEIKLESVKIEGPTIKCENW